MVMCPFCGTSVPYGVKVCKGCMAEISYPHWSEWLSVLFYVAALLLLFYGFEEGGVLFILIGIVSGVSAFRVEGIYKRAKASERVTPIFKRAKLF